MSKFLFALIALTISCSALASYDVDVPSIEGTPCSVEGERTYVTNGENDDVYYCKDGKWAFLYTREPGDDRN